MKKKLSLYWCCQITGWSVLFATGLLSYYSMFGSIWNFAPLLFSGLLLGLLITHIMRLFIIKGGILQLPIWKQIIYILFTTVIFSFFYALAEILLAVTLNWGKEILNFYVNKGKILLITQVTFNDSVLLSVWNLIYFSYHYVEKSRREQIEKISFENKLKIEKLESDKAKIEFQRNLADISLTALRSQMNPHFIFNCLNSIKLYTVQNDTEAAVEYLTKFSKLIRLVMDNSAKAKILLASEIDMLRLYIEMEAMRFKEKLQYNIHLEKDVEPDYIELPPLLLQPYVENAIWHGLMPKEEGGKIDIEVSMNNDSSLLQIIISDNGIGRLKSEELNRGKITKHESYGMKVTSNRIALINQVYKSGADVTIEDLMDTSGKAEGTRVIIQIPV